MAHWSEIAEAVKIKWLGGMTLREIGSEYSISGEYVRQILRKVGVASAARKPRISKQERKLSNNIAHITKWGFSREDKKNYIEKWSERGISPVRIFSQQQYNAKRRGLDWKLTLGEWAEIWGERLHLRGTGINDLCMCRYCDAGAYEVGNVYISTASQNHKDYYVFKKNIVKTLADV